MNVKNDHVLIVTLARGGSKGVPDKNLQVIGKRNLPLIAYAVEAIATSKLFGSMYTHAALSTDNSKIKLAARHHADRFHDSYYWIIDRPAELASDVATTADALKHAVEYMERDCHCTYDTIIEVMCTSPLRTNNDIDKCYQQYVNARDAGNADSAASITRLYNHHPSRVKYTDQNGLLLPFFPETPESRRQDLLPAAFVRAGGIYVTSRDVLMNQNRRVGNMCLGVEISPESALGIDEAVDLKVADIVMRQREELMNVQL